MGSVSYSRNLFVLVCGIKFLQDCKDVTVTLNYFASQEVPAKE